MPNNLAYNAFKYVMIDLIGDVLYWPIWWYTKGLKKAVFYCLKEIGDQEERLGLTIWVKNIFTPMFGQYDIEGRIISFFARLIQIIIRSMIFIILVTLILILFLAWIFVPVIIFYQITNNFLFLFR